METIKRGRGRPKGSGKKEPTYCKGFRFQKPLREFFSSLENSNSFFIETITNTPEYKAFIAKREAKQKGVRMEYLVFGSIILGFCVIAYSAYTATLENNK